MNQICSNVEIMNKINMIMNEDISHMTQYYDINKGHDNITQLVNCLKNMSQDYIYEYGGLNKSRLDWSKWKILYNNIFIEIKFDYNEYEETSEISLKYIETEINETDIEKIIDNLSFLQPKYCFNTKSKTRQEIQQYKSEMMEKETKRAEEMIQNNEKKRFEKGKKREEIISNSNWSDYIKRFIV